MFGYKDTKMLRLQRYKVFHQIQAHLQQAPKQLAITVATGNNRLNMHTDQFKEVANVTR